MAEYTPEERRRIRDGLGRVVSPATDEVLDALIDLGFSRSTIGVIGLVPLVYVAWADGNVDKKEADTIMAIAQERGLKGPALAMLDRLMHYKPDETFLRRSLRILVRMYGALPIQEGTRAKKSLIDLAYEVAQASGGFLGVIGDKVCNEERDLIEEIAKSLRISKSERAEALRQDLVTRHEIPILDFDDLEY